MATFDWKLLEISAANGVLKSVNYLVTAKEGDHEVQSQGHADIEGKINLPFADVREADILTCLQEMYMQDEPKSLKSRLQKQLDYLKTDVNTDLPWQNQVFSVKF
jgi:hypothetical protein